MPQSESANPVIPIAARYALAYDPAKWLSSDTTTNQSPTLRKNAKDEAPGHPRVPTDERG